MVRNNAVNWWDYLGLKQVTKTLKTKCGNFEVECEGQKGTQKSPSTGKPQPVIGADMSTTCPKKSDCDCVSYRFDQDVIKDNDPGRPANPPYNDADVKIPPGGQFHDVPSIPVTNLPPFNPKGPAKGHVEFKVTIYCVKKDGTQSKLTDYKWGFKGGANMKSKQYEVDCYIK